MGQKCSKMAKEQYNKLLFEFNRDRQNKDEQIENGRVFDSPEYADRNLEYDPSNQNEINGQYGQTTIEPIPQNQRVGDNEGSAEYNVRYNIFKDPNNTIPPKNIGYQTNFGNMDEINNRMIQKERQNALLKERLRQVGSSL